MFEDPFVRNTLTPILAIAGSILGLAGTCIGVINLWLTYKTHRVKVRVKPFYAARGNDADGTPNYLEIGVAVINASYFPITVTEVGLIIKSHVFKKALLVPFSFRPNLKSQIDSRSKLDFTRYMRAATALQGGEFFLYSDYPAFPHILAAKGAYVKLATDQTIKSPTNKSLRQFLDDAELFQKKITTPAG